MNAKTLLFVVASVVLYQVPYAFAGQTGQPNRFRHLLEQGGFVVRQGQSSSLDMWQQYCDEVTDTARYNNKGAPYLTAVVPHLPDDPTLIPYVFQLRPDEAIVLIGVTPPPETYFSYQPYLLDKFYKQPIPAGFLASPIQGCHPEDTHCLDVGTSLGDAVNVATIKTIGPDPYNAPMVLIFTPDQGTEAHVRAALKKAGYPTAIVNTIVFPVSMLNMGIGYGHDLFMILGRNAMWLNGATGEAAGQAYMDSLNSTDPAKPSPVSVFRVTPKVFSAANLKPFPAPPLRIRGTGETEMELMGKMDELRENLISQYTQMGYVVAGEYTSAPGGYDGYDFIQQMKRAYLDSRDTIYVGSGAEVFHDTYDITLADDEFMVIYGVNHTATGKATYMNLNAYAREPQLAIGSIFDTDFAHSADAYLPAGDSAEPLMFSYKIAWQCDGPFCLQMSSDGCDRFPLDDPIKRESTQLAFATRAYLEPATNIGPAFTEVVYQRMIKFSPRP